MDLEQQPGPQSALPQRPIDAQHGDLYDVRRGPLDGSVERHSLGHLPTLRIVTGKIGKVTAPSEDRLRVTIGTSLFDHPAQEVPYPAEPGEVRLHLRTGLFRMDAELAGEPEGGEPVGQPVGHGLDPAAQLGINRVHRQTECLGCHVGVQVLAGGECLDQSLVAGQMRHDAHFDLGVVGREQGLVPRADDERPADLTALRRAYRDVLQVRVGRGQPAGRRDHLVERRVDAAGIVDHRYERVDHRTQPGNVTMAQQHRQERMVGLSGEPGQRVRVGGVASLDLLGFGQAQLVEQDGLQLLG